MKEKGERVRLMFHWRFLIHSYNLQEKLDNDYHDKLETNKINAAQRTAKKRQKRLKRKEKSKGKKKKTIGQLSQNSGSESSSNDSDDEKPEFQNEIEKQCSNATDEAQKLETINSQMKPTQNDDAVTNTELHVENELTTADEHAKEEENADTTNKLNTAADIEAVNALNTKDKDAQGTD